MGVTVPKRMMVVESKLNLIHGVLIIPAIEALWSVVLIGEVAVDGMKLP